jgi:alkylation response protein AidB-like acyl-CoA dehydrogenase
MTVSADLNPAESFLHQVDTFLKEWVAPRAALLDQDPQALRQALQHLGDRALLGLKIPERWQGQGLDELTFRQFQEQVARYSGALAFLQTQHQSAASMLAKSANAALQQAYLPHLSRGEVLLGIGYSQLRHSGPPLIQATPISGGYRIQGEVPWVTGYGCFQEFIVGATLPGDRLLFGIVPLESVEQAEGGRIVLSSPLHLAAMASTNTVKARFLDWVLPESYVVAIQPAHWIRQNDQRNVLHHSFFALGCAQAGLDIVTQTQDGDRPWIANTLAALDRELKSCRQATYQAQGEASENMLPHLPLRAWAIELAVRCAHAAVTVSRGSANYSYHPAQRVYREALAFTVFGQTPAVMEATLAQLVNPEFAEH